VNERIDAIILSDHDTYYRGWVQPNHDKEGTYAVLIDRNEHPYIKVGDKIPIKDMLIPHKIV